MGVSKVVYNNQTLIDLTGDTVTAETLAKGTTAHGADGEPIEGTMEAGGGSGSPELKTTAVTIILDPDTEAFGPLSSCSIYYIGLENGSVAYKIETITNDTTITCLADSIIFIHETNMMVYSTKNADMVYYVNYMETMTAEGSALIHVGDYTTAEIILSNPEMADI